MNIKGNLDFVKLKMTDVNFYVHLLCIKLDTKQQTLNIERRDYVMCIKNCWALFSKTHNSFAQIKINYLCDHGCSSLYTYNIK